MIDDLEKARSEAVQEVTSAMLVAAVRLLSRHGNDPFSEAILCAAVAMFVNKVDRADGVLPGFKTRLVALLTKEIRS